MIRSQCLLICSCFFQCSFHFFNGNLRWIIENSINFLRMIKSFFNPFDTWKPLQGLFADIISTHNKCNLSLFVCSLCCPIHSQYEYKHTPGKDSLPYVITIFYDSFSFCNRSFLNVVHIRNNYFNGKNQYKNGDCRTLFSF